MLLTNTALSGIRTMTDNHRIVMPSDKPNPGRGEERRRDPRGTASSGIGPGRTVLTRALHTEAAGPDRVRAAQFGPRLA